MAQTFPPGVTIRNTGVSTREIRRHDNHTLGVTLGKYNRGITAPHWIES